MTSESQVLTVTVERPYEQVYGYISDPQNMADWAAGLGAAPEPAGDGSWIVQTPGGPAVVRFAGPNDFGIVDHWVAAQEVQEETVYVPLRVVRNREGADVQFTLFRQPGMSDADLARDAESVRADLDRLKSLLER